MMELKEFIENFAAQFEDTDASELKAETEYKELDEWSSLIALNVVSMVDEVYGVAIEYSDFREAKTIEELFNLVKSRA